MSTEHSTLLSPEPTVRRRHSKRTPITVHYIGVECPEYWSATEPQRVWAEALCNLFFAFAAL